MPFYECRNEGTPFNGGGFFKSFPDDGKYQYNVRVHVQLDNTSIGTPLIRNGIRVNGAIKNEVTGNATSPQGQVYITYNEDDQSIQLNTDFSTILASNCSYTAMAGGSTPEYITETTMLSYTLPSNAVSIIDENTLSLKVICRMTTTGTIKVPSQGVTMTMSADDTIGEATLVIDLKSSAFVPAYSDYFGITEHKTSTKSSPAGDVVAYGAITISNAIRIIAEVTEITKQKIQ